MPYFCFVESTSTAVPHMELLDADCLDQARSETQRLLGQHSSAARARIFLDAVEMDILRRHGSGPKSIGSENRLLASTGLSLGGERRHLKAGDRVTDDGDMILFPLDAIIRIEAADRGLLAGWEDRNGAVGLVPLAIPGSLQWIVQIDGYAVAVERLKIVNLLREDPAFNAAVLHWLAQSRQDALLQATLNLQDTAPDRILRLLKELAARQSSGPISICQSELARLSGIQRTTVCSVMSRLRDVGAVSYSRGRITIFHPDRLVGARLNVRIGSNTGVGIDAETGD